ncbi:ester cyclase [soil metagenome]
MSEENKALVRREFEEMFNHDGNLDAAGEFYTPDYILHDPTFGKVRGIDGAKEFAATYREAFPDLRVTIEDQMSDADKVISRFRSSGTHDGETPELGPATGNRVEITGITIDRFAGGKIVEEWTNYDALALMQQIGLVPEQDQARS